MPQIENAFGLKRPIPEPIKREVRQRCGFGCVVCGSAFYHYDHLETEFRDAREHKADEITLLCSQHHDDKTYKRLTKNQVLASDKNPYCRQHGHPHHKMFLGGEPPEVKLGDIKVGRVMSVMEVDGIPLIGFNYIDNDWCRFALNANFIDKDGTELLRICDNEIQVIPDSWDVRAVGTSIKVRSGPGKILLEISLTPPNGIWVKRASWRIKGFSIDVLPDGRLKINDFFIHGGEYGNARSAFACYTKLPFEDPLA